MQMHAPQLILLAFMILGTGIHLARHGEPKKDTYSFWWAITGDAFTISLLCWGGFFG